MNAADGPWAGESRHAGSPQRLIMVDTNLNNLNNTIAHERCLQ
jgi:hypothetical protein